MIEDINYLVYTLADGSASEAEKILNLNTDGFYQMLLANKRKVLDIENNRKREERKKEETKRRR